MKAKQDKNIYLDILGCYFSEFTFHHHFEAS